MILNFTPIEVRILGCLLEKQLATPDYYPMTENAIILASNQKSSRDPVLNIQSDQANEALTSLSRKEFIEQIRVNGSRAFKYRQRLDLRWSISNLNAETNRDKLAVLSVLCLRGPQTLGQIRQRTERLFSFPDITSVKTIILELSEETEDRPALVSEDHSIPGREVRYTHLLSEHQSNGGAVVIPQLDPHSDTNMQDQIEALKKRITSLENLILSNKVAATPELNPNEEAGK